MSAYLFGAFYTILFVLLCNMFLEIYEVKREVTNKAWQGVLLAALMGVIYIITIIFANLYIGKEILILISTTLVMGKYYEQKIGKIFVLVLLYQGAGLAIDYATIIFVSKCFPAITYTRLSEPMMHILIGALSQVLLFCFVLFLKKLFERKLSVALTTGEWVRFVIFPVFTIMVIIALLTGFEIPLNNSQKNILIFVAFGLIVLNIMVFYLIRDILKREVQLREHKILMESVKQETEHYDKQRKREHEYKNQIALIAALAKEHKIDELNEYLKDYTKAFVDKMDSIDTNHVIVNSILNLKYQEAKEKGIIFVVKISDLSELRIKDDDMVLILSNLLNNSIEDRYITTKMTNTKEHGVGIENIKEAVGKYGGTCVIKHNESSFQFSILIPEQRGIS